MPRGSKHGMSRAALVHTRYVRMGRTRMGRACARARNACARMGRAGEQTGRPCAHWGIDLFIEEGAYTTVASAVAMLMVLALLFSATLAVWSAGRSGDVQANADTTALAGANVVSSYHTVAMVLDACALSMGLAGFAMTGVGMIGAFVPGAQSAATKTLDAGIDMLEARNTFVTSASRGLKTLEGSLPYLVAANATRASTAQNTESITYTGSALAAPSTSASEFPALEGDQIALDDLTQESQELEQAAEDLSQISEEVAAKKEAAWLADCGRDGRNMQERAARLSGIAAEDNPDFASSTVWEPNVALERARAYYRWRYEHDEPEGQGVEARADAAARHAFYGYALQMLEDAQVVERDGVITSTVELLPKNTDEVRRTKLYTDAVWPSSVEDDGLTLHFSSSCPGVAGAQGPLIALASIEEGSARECPVCKFGVGDVGKAPAASTSIDNGFEYHLRAYTLALDEYVAARQRELDEQARARGEAEQAGSAFEQAISALSGKRPRIAPPGRNGCIALVVASAVDSPDELETPFAASEGIAERGAISAAALAPDRATRENNVLSSFFSSLEERVGSGGAVGLVDSVMDLWGELLVSYGEAGAGVDKAFGDIVDGLEGLGLGPVGSWLSERLQGIVRALGIEPVDLSQRKPVLTDSAHVAQASGMQGYVNVQTVLRDIPAGSTDPEAIVRAVGYAVEDRIMSMELTVAEIPLPGGGALPLTVRVRDIALLVGEGT